VKPFIGAMLLACSLLHAQSAGQPDPVKESVISLTPMIGTTIDVAPYGIEAAYTDFALSVSSDKIPVISLWGVVLLSAEAVYFRAPLMLSFRADHSPLGLLIGGGPGSWNDGTGVKVLPVFYGGMNVILGGWSLNSFVSVIFESDGSTDLVLDVLVGRSIGF
jgi:hypothetical protein